MEYNTIKLTKQLKKAFRIAEQECISLGSPCILPEHLLLGCLDDGSFPVKEAKQKAGIQYARIRNSITIQARNPQCERSSIFNLPISKIAGKVLDASITCMVNYNQVYLNEGHVLKALIKTGLMDSFLTEEQRNSILDLAASSRDMHLKLLDYTQPALRYKKIRKAYPSDSGKLSAFIEQEFGTRWSASIQEGLKQEAAGIYYIEDPVGKILGFAAYNLHSEGHFGPMGVAKNKRAEGIGKSLLHYCLNLMKRKGYEEVIIDEAGPIEFYERTCNAKVISS